MYARLSTSLIALLPAILLLGCGLLPTEDPFLAGGIQVNEPDHEKWVDSLLANGLNTVAVTVYAHQGHWNTDHLWFDEDTEWVVNEVRAAKRKGLKVVLVLRVALDHTYEANQFLWHGMIMPGTEEQLHSWFRRYGRFVNDWAKVAEQEGVDVLGVGSELNALASTLPVLTVPNLESYYLDPLKQEEFKQDVRDFSESSGETVPGSEAFSSLEEFLTAKVAAYERWARSMSAEGSETALDAINTRRGLLNHLWTALVADARQVFSGQLTYAANFDQYHEVGFWDQLDLMGVNAYFPLRKQFLDDATSLELRTALEQGWREVFDTLVSFQQEQELGDLPVLFTELGYTQRKGATLAPWAGDGFTVVWGEKSSEVILAPEEPSTPEVLSGAREEQVDKRMLIWRNQPVEPGERLSALKALRTVVEADYPGLLQGILYWKLSTVPSHLEIEPFVALVPEDAGTSSFVEELASFDFSKP